MDFHGTVLLGRKFASNLCDAEATARFRTSICKYKLVQPGNILNPSKPPHASTGPILSYESSKCVCA